MTFTVLKKLGQVEKKISDTSGLVKSTIYNTKIGELQNKITNVSGLVRKTEYNTNISDIVAKYFTTFDHSKFTSQTIETKIT